MANEKPAKKPNSVKAKKPKDKVAGCRSSSISSGSGDAVTPCLSDDKIKLAKNEDDSLDSTA